MTTGSPLPRIWSQIVVSTLSSPPGCSPNWISSRTAQATHRSSVTRATAANPIPVVRHTTSRIIGTASIRATAATSASILPVRCLLKPSPNLPDDSLPA